MPSKNKKILFLVPIPPPYAGPEIANELLLSSETIRNANIVHVNSNIRKNNSEKGNFDLKGIFSMLRIYFRILGLFLFGNVNVFYFLLSSSKIGFLRDSIYILTAKLFRKKIVGHYRGSNFDGFYNSQSVKYQKYIKRVVNKCDRIIVQAEIIKPIFNDIFPIENVYVVYNGIKTNKKYFYKINNASPNHRETKLNEENGVLLQKLSKETEVFKFLFMGHLWYPKGFYDLIIAYKKLYSEYGNKVQLLYAGEKMDYNPNALEFLKGEFKEKYLKEGRQIAAEIMEFINNQDKFNANHLGFIAGEKKQEILNSVDVFTLPSYTEGFSMAVLEAMNAGLPVVVTPVGALPEVVVHKQNGLITDIGSPENLYASIKLLIENNDLRNKISNNNKNYVSENFSVDVVANQLINVLRF